VCCVAFDVVSPLLINACGVFNSHVHPFCYVLILCRYEWTSFASGAVAAAASVTSAFLWLGWQNDMLLPVHTAFKSGIGLFVGVSFFLLFVAAALQVVVIAAGYALAQMAKGRTDGELRMIAKDAAASDAAVAVGMDTSRDVESGTTSTPTTMRVSDNPRISGNNGGGIAGSRPAPTPAPAAVIGGGAGGAGFGADGAPAAPGW
jgi:hypothetical protein